MPACPNCATELPESATICPRCSSPTPWSSDVTHLAGLPHKQDLPPTPDLPPKGGSYRTTTSSWLSTTDAIDHGRFPPGTLLAGRYRIVGRLGKGGMGEVYRADDLKLGQPVALKFLPDELLRDGAALARFHREVRIARQVS